MQAMKAAALIEPASGESTVGILTSEGVPWREPIPWEEGWGWMSAGAPHVGFPLLGLSQRGIGGRGLSEVAAELGSKRRGLRMLMWAKLSTLRLAGCFALAVCQIVSTNAAPAGCGGADHFFEQSMDCVGMRVGARAGECVVMESSGSRGVQRRVAGARDREGQAVVAAVHRRWSPWHLRFGLREAWCSSSPPPFFSVYELALVNLCRPDPVCKRGRGSTEEQKDFQVKSEFARAPLMASTATDPPRAALRNGCRGVPSDLLFNAGCAGMTSCGWAWLGQDGEQKAGNGGRVKPRGDPLLARYPSADQVTQYFSEALDERPVCRGRDMVIFQRSECFGWGVSWRRGLVEVLPFGVGVRWLANDDFGLSELREFFEAGFFKPADTERFYRWLAEGGWHQESLEGGVTLKMGVLRGRRATMVEISWQRGG